MEMTENKLLVRELGFVPQSERGEATDYLMWNFIQTNEQHEVNYAKLRPLRYGVIEALGKKSSGKYQIKDKVVYNVNQARFVDTGNGFKMSVRENMVFGRIN